MDVFGAAATSEFLRDAALAAADELGVFEAVREPRMLDEIADALGLASSRRLRSLLDVLVAFGALVRHGCRFALATVPARRALPAAGWGRLAEVIRTDRPLALDAELQERMHRHLVEAGADAARELAPLLGETSLLDLGGGAGAYTAAFLAARSAARVTLVDHPDVVALARGELARFGERVEFVEGDARAVQLRENFGTTLLANVLHLHGPTTCAQLCAVAARSIAAGGMVVIKDLRVDEGRGGPLEGLLFALNMALYTEHGDVYSTAQLREWLVEAGLVDIEEHRLAASPDAIVVCGRKPADDAIARELDSMLSRAGKVAWRELEVAGTLRDGAQPMRLRFPAPLRHALARAVAQDDGDTFARHYIEVMPHMRVAQIAGIAAPGVRLMHAPLDWTRLPRLTAALDRLFAVVEAAGVEPERPLGAASAAQFRARTPTLAALYTRTHYGACMPPFYGHSADLTYFAARARERGFDLMARVDRYLTALVIHELCHFGRDREALPLHLDECVAGWLGVHVWPELAYPEPGEDDAIFAAPWLAQIGQAFARAFGVDAIVRGHTGAAIWRAVLPASVIDAAARLYDEDWRVRRTLHFLSDTLVPQPWLALVLAQPLPPDDAFDRAIVADALRAMCLANEHVAGTLRAYTRVPEAAIEIDARGITTARRGIDRVDPWYWLPPAVAARIGAGYTLQLGDIRAIPEVADAICAGSRGLARDGFALVVR